MVLVGATRNPVLLRQWSVLLWALRATAGTAWTGDAGAFQARGITGTHLAASAPMTQSEATAYLEQRTRAFVADIRKPALLVVIGGDTLRALCVAAGTRTLIARPSPREGWGAARLVGGHWHGVMCLSRSGAFGSDDDLVELLLT